MAMNLETAMKIAEEEDLWIGDSGASSHMMGSEEHVFNKILITGSVRTANGAHMKCCVKETSMLMSSPRMVMLQVVH